MAQRTGFTIGRPVDFGYRTNQVIAGLALLALVTIGALRLSQGELLADAARQGGGAAIIVFLSWALGREIDPDNQWAAFVGPALAFGYVLTNGSAGFLYGFWALLALRFINRTPGRASTWLDSVIGAGVALWLVSQGTWVAGLAMAAAFALDAALSPANRQQWIAAGTVLVATAVLTGIPSYDGLAGVEQPAWTLLALSVVVMAVVIIGSRKVTSVCDARGAPLIARRVQAAQAFAVLTVLGTVLAHGAAGFESAVALWAAMLGVGVYRIADWPFARAQLN